MGQALYRSHRPKKLGDVVGQEHITTALEHALKQGTFSHAYLFTGPRGTGKTTIARILAHEINALPYEDDTMHLDIIEIDAASNRRIDEIRDLRDKVNLAPTSAKFKVYIIDEVHMLTREAFNALLKTLEEPPAHVVFMLATTEMHKLPETIVSRTQHFALHPVELAKVVAHLRAIADQEKIAVDDDALQLIAQHGEGSFRDSISLLDQLRNQSGTITLADVQMRLGVAPEEAIAALIASVQQHDAVDVSAQLRTLHEQGYEPGHVARQLGQALRAALVSKAPALPPEATLALLAQLVAVPASPDPRVALEIAVLDAAFRGASVVAPPAKPAASKTMSEAVQAKPASITAPHPSSFKKDLNTAKPAEVPAHAKEPIAEPDIDAESDADAASTETLTPAAWDQTLGAIKTQYNTLYGLLRGASATFEPGAVVLTMPFAFHQKRLNEQKNRDIIARTVESVSGQKMRIRCVVGAVEQSATTPPPLPPESAETVHVVAAPQPQETLVQPKADAVTTVSNIFGGAELLQS